MGNSFLPVDPRLIDIFPQDHDGYPHHLAVKDTPDALRDACGAATREFPSALWIDRKDWKARAEQNDALNTWPINYIDRYTNQSPTDECTCHSLRANFETARNRSAGIIFEEGPKKNFRYPQSAKRSVWISPMSVYDEANPSIRGGASVRQVLEIMCRRGALPDTTQPREYGYKHAIAGTMGQGNTNQSHGAWVSVKNLPEGWEATAATLKPLEVIFAADWEQAVCLVLNGIAYSVGRNGHAIPWCRWRDSQEVMEYPDSYDRTLYDSLSTVKRAWQGGFGIATVTAPDDWNNPAGI